MLLPGSTMCCVYGKTPFRFGVYKDVWSMRDLLRVLDHHNLSAAPGDELTPLGISEGGLKWPATAANTARWKRDTSSHDTGGVDRELRISSYAPTDWPWIPETHYSTWTGDLPDAEISRGVMEFNAKCSPSISAICALIESFRACGHPLVYTEGLIPLGSDGRFKRRKTRTWYLKPTAHVWRAPSVQSDLL